MFTTNDCAIGNVHPCDIATIVPIFWDGKLIGWVGGVTHVIDTGAVTPGSMSTGQTQRFGDGYMITCRKTGVNDDRCATGCTNRSARCARPSTGFSTRKPASPAAT
jgi:acetone carboxylase alpha subunit